MNGTLRSIDSAVEVWESALCAQVDPELFFDLVVPHGVVGGLTDRERRDRRRGQRRQGRAA